jgi:NAD(P)H dehydrogenase (quinone)
MKNILLIQGHPDPESFNFALYAAYKKGAETSGNANIEEIIVRNLDFNPNLEFGYRKRTELEPDLLESIEKIKQADHIVLFFPVWWGSMPAILKGFFDRTFLPTIAFKKREGSVWWDKYFTGKSAHVVTTMDQPTWFYRWINGRPTYYALKKLTFQFVGIDKVKMTTIGPLRLSKVEWREKQLAKMEKLGRRNK